MGAAGTRLGRNVPMRRTRPEWGERSQMIPATTLNVLAGAWLQFQRVAGTGG